MIEISVCCDDCGILGAAAQTAAKARADLRGWADPWVCRRRDGKQVDLCGPCDRADKAHRDGRRRPAIHDEEACAPGDERTIHDPNLDINDPDDRLVMNGYEEGYDCPTNGMDGSE